MAICRVKKNKNYTTMSNHHLRDKNLSNKARGLLSTMLSLPETWDYTTRGLAMICKDGVDGISTQLKELERCGYLVRHKVRDSTGRIIDMEYLIYEEPLSASPHTETPDTVVPETDLSYLEIPSQRNTEKINTDKASTYPSTTHSIRYDTYPTKYGNRNEMNSKKISEIRDQIQQNINYDFLLQDMPFEHDRLEEILELIVETVCSNKEFIRVAGSDYPSAFVRRRLMELDMEHIKFIFECLSENTTRIRNIKQYLLTALFNAPTTMGNYYSQLVQHDFSKGG